MSDQTPASRPETCGVPVSQEVAFQTPEWAKHAVWYQIMLDRFRNGNPDNDPLPQCMATPTSRRNPRY
jgi:hypothetical protein